MAGVNKAIIVGNLGQDPEVRFMPNGKAACNFTVATSENWKDKQTGEQKEKTEWHRIAMFDKLAEIAGEYLKKGSKVYIEGQLQTRKWQNQQGQDQYTTEIVVQGFNGVMQMLDSKGNQQTGEFKAPQQGQQQAPSQQGYKNQPNPTYQQQQSPKFIPQNEQQAPNNNFDDNIPF
tara:strand:- start:43 stop:567 length:525 start_codon:yes stop_codon:yes gene_type:complete